MYFGVLAPVLVAVLALMLWLLVSNDPEGSVGGAVFAGITGVGMTALMWAVGWRPLVRAEKASGHAPHRHLVSAS